LQKNALAPARQFEQTEVFLATASIKYSIADKSENNHRLIFKRALYRAILKLIASSALARRKNV